MVKIHRDRKKNDGRQEPRWGRGSECLMGGRVSGGGDECLLEMGRMMPANLFLCLMPRTVQIKMVNLCLFYHNNKKKWGEQKQRLIKWMRTQHLSFLWAMKQTPRGRSSFPDLVQKHKVQIRKRNKGKRGVMSSRFKNTSNCICECGSDRTHVSKTDTTFKVMNLLLWGLYLSFIGMDPVSLPIKFPAARRHAMFEYQTQGTHLNN